MENLHECVDMDFLQACSRYGEYFLQNIKAYKYTPFRQIYQKGPTCGLTALGMYCRLNSTDEILNVILEEAKRMEFTKQGEMFSVVNMLTLTQKLTDKKVELFNEYLACDEIIKFLLDGGVMLVPYDSDVNHEPCLRDGHKAHWALILGIIECHSGAVYVLARQGKSRLLGIWALSLLAASNQQLNVVSPDRRNSMEYVLPEGGLAGQKGVCGKSILIYHHL